MISLIFGVQLILINIIIILGVQLSNYFRRHISPIILQAYFFYQKRNKARKGNYPEIKRRNETPITSSETCKEMLEVTSTCHSKSGSWLNYQLPN